MIIFAIISAWGIYGIAVVLAALKKIPELTPATNIVVQAAVADLNQKEVLLCSTTCWALHTFASLQLYPHTRPIDPAVDCCSASRKKSSASSKKSIASKRVANSTLCQAASKCSW